MRRNEQTRCSLGKEPKKRKNSRAKGAAGERELAHYLRARGGRARRGQQFRGGAESPDVVGAGLADWHIECKRVEAGNLYTWLAQSIRDAGKKKRPLVAHRKNNQDWVVVMRLHDFLETIVQIGL